MTENRRPESTGFRGRAADSGRDVDLSNIELMSMSSSRLLPILRMGAGALDLSFLLERGGRTSASCHEQGTRMHWRHCVQWSLETAMGEEELALRCPKPASSGEAAEGRRRQCIPFLLGALVPLWLVLGREEDLCSSV